MVGTENARLEHHLEIKVARMELESLNELLRMGCRDPDWLRTFHPIRTMSGKPTIAELEAILNDPSEMDLGILPNGEVLAVEKGTSKKHEVRVITAKYAAAEFY